MRAVFGKDSPCRFRFLSSSSWLYLVTQKRCLTQGDNSFMNNYGTGTASSRRRFLLGTTFFLDPAGDLNARSLAIVFVMECPTTWRMRSPVCTYFIFLSQSWFSRKCFLFVSPRIFLLLLVQLAREYHHIMPYNPENIITLYNSWSDAANEWERSAIHIRFWATDH